MKSALFFTFLFLFMWQNNSAQTACQGEQIFTEKHCIGDEISDNEKALYTLVNEYRKQNKLNEIPIGEKACLVANRHLLDLHSNFGKITHSWSGCQYDSNDQKTYGCILDAPKRFFPDFSGKAFENIYYTSGKRVDLASALEGWKKSPLHNAVILNQNIFKSQQWTEGCVSIQDNFAALWFIAEKGNASTNIDSKIPDFKGLGITYEQAVRGLTSILSISNVSSTTDSQKWLGTSSDKTVVLEIFGKEEDISEGKMSLRIRLRKDKTISLNNRKILLTFLGNLAPNWNTRTQWLDGSLAKIVKSSKQTETINLNNITAELKLESDGYISLTVKPTPKDVPIEY